MARHHKTNHATEPAQKKKGVPKGPQLLVVLLSQASLVGPRLVYIFWFGLVVRTVRFSRTG